MHCMDAANLGFLARQLLLTELRGEAEDIDGGMLVSGAELWAGIWQPAEMGNFEIFIQSLQRTAQQRGLPLRGLVLLVPPARDDTELIAELAETLYVYELPQRRGLPAGGPDAVQVLSGPLDCANVAGFSTEWVSPADEGFTAIAAPAIKAVEQLSAPWNTPRAEWLSGADCCIASVSGQPVGIAALHSSEVASRISLLWVVPEARGAGLGRVILAEACRRAADRGRLLCSVWSYRAGTLRFYLSKQGFAEQLSALYFVAED